MASHTTTIGKGCCCFGLQLHLRWCVTSSSSRQQPALHKNGEEKEKGVNERSDFWFVVHSNPKMNTFFHVSLSYLSYLSHKALQLSTREEARLLFIPFSIYSLRLRLPSLARSAITACPRRQRLFRRGRGNPDQSFWWHAGVCDIIEYAEESFGEKPKRKIGNSSSNVTGNYQYQFRSPRDEPH